MCVDCTTNMCVTVQQICDCTTNIQMYDCTTRLRVVQKGYFWYLLG